MPRSSLPPVSPKRKRMRQKLDTFGPLSDWLRQGACLLKYQWESTPCWGDLEAAHVLSRGMGGGRGDWVGCSRCQGEGCGYCGGHGKVANVTRLCHGHHREYSRAPEAFEKEWGVAQMARLDGIDFLNRGR